jgi:hypothetical protein
VIAAALILLFYVLTSTVVSWFLGRTLRVATMDVLTDPYWYTQLEHLDIHVMMSLGRQMGRQGGGWDPSQFREVTGRLDRAEQILLQQLDLDPADRLAQSLLADVRAVRGQLP